jgi:hypothetical protein
VTHEQILQKVHDMGCIGVSSKRILPDFLLRSFLVKRMPSDQQKMGFKVGGGWIDFITQKIKEQERKIMDLLSFMLNMRSNPNLCTYLETKCYYEHIRFCYVIIYKNISQRM